MNALVTTTRTVTKTPIDKTALEQFIGMLPLLLIILGMFIILLVVVKMTLKDESTSPMMDCDLSNNISNQLMRQIVKESEFYYKNNRRQMIAIFICALISCFAGLALLIFSALYFADEAKTMGIIGGIIINFISSIIFWIYKQCSKQVQCDFNTLIHLQNICLAIELINDCDDEIQNRKKEALIDKLLESSRFLYSGKEEQSPLPFSFSLIDFNLYITLLIILYHFCNSFSFCKHNTQSIYLHKPHKYQEALLVIPYHLLFWERLLESYDLSHPAPLKSPHPFLLLNQR